MRTASVASRRFWLSRALLCALFVICAHSCATSATQHRRLLDQAQDLNIATRFGRLDVASQLAAPAAKATFMERRKQWGRDVRVLDTQVSHVQLVGDQGAEVTVQVDWTHMSEGRLRSTWLLQQWQSSSQGAWLLESEKQVEGDPGLFGEVALQSLGERTPDRHFETRSLGVTPQ